MFGARLGEAQVEHIWNNGLVEKEKNKKRREEEEEEETLCPPVCASSACFNPCVTF